MRALAVIVAAICVTATTFTTDHAASGAPPAAAATWRLEGAPRVFAGTDLSNYIDGGAEIFLEFGFERVTVQRYRAAEDEITVETYAMADSLAALGVYLAKCGKETPDARLGERHTAGRYQLVFVRNRYFVILNNESGKAEYVDTLIERARVLAATMPAQQPVTVFGVLPREGLIGGTQRLIRGPVMLASIFTLGDGDILHLGGAITAVAAEYDAGGGARRAVIITDYPAVDAAAQAFAHVRDRLDAALTRVGLAPARLVFRDYEGKFGVVERDGARLTITLHLVNDPTR